MDWWLILLLIFGAVFALLAVGLPVAFTFLLINIVGVFVLQGGGRAFHQLILSIYSSVSTFTLLPVPLFVLMGEILWHSRIADRALGALDKVLGRVPGRLGLLTILSGAVFSALSGSTMANTAMLGSLLLPDMHRRRYAGDLSMGTIMASGGLAMLIPPSALAVIFAAVAKVSIGKLLLALIAPGLILAAMYALYVMARALLNPAIAPVYEVGSVPFREKALGVVKYVLPLSIIVFLVVGVIFFGIATPTEAAAFGCLGSLGMALAYGGLTRERLLSALRGTLFVSVMMLTILMGAIGFSQILAYSGATRALLASVTELPVAPIVLVFLMQVVVMVLGCFMEQIAIMMITLPIFIPIVKSLGLDPIWFSVVMLINLEMALLTPPFGLLLFVMKGVAPPEVSMNQIYAAALPFVVIDFAAIVLLLAFPEVSLFLPRLAL